MSAATFSHQIRQDCGDNAASECTTRHWSQNFKLKDQSICDEPCSGQPLDDEALKVSIEEDDSKSFGELCWMLPSFCWNSQTSPVQHRESIQVEQVDTPHTTGSQQVTACFSLLQCTHIWSSAHQGWKVSPIWYSKACPILVVTTGSCSSHHKTTYTTMQDHALYLMD